MKRIERTRKQRMCTKCGHALLGAILWGLPHMESKLEELMNAGKIIIGGCCLSGEDATWECSKCHQQIWKPISEDELIGGECR